MLHTVIAIVLAVIASGFFALGATGQHLGVERNFAKEGTAERALTLKRLLRLIVTPLWIGGLACVGLGAGIHVIGLSMAPLAVIQPVGILAVPFSILLANRIHRTTTTASMWWAVLLTIVGIVLFTTFSAFSTQAGQTPHWTRLLLSSGFVWGVAAVLVLLAWKGPRTLACMCWALAGAGLYGLGSVYIKILTVEFQNGTIGHNFVISLVLLAVSYAVGGWLIQQGYASGAAPIVVGCMTTFDPIVAVLFGLVVLGEGNFHNLWYVVAMLLGAVAAVVGVFLLSKYHPDAVQRSEPSGLDSDEPARAKEETIG